MTVRRARLAVAAMLLCAVGAGAATPVVAQEVACAQPYAPVYAALTVFGTGDNREVAPTFARELAVQELPQAPYPIEERGDEIAIGLPAGEVVLHADAGKLYSSPLAVGDLDGDGLPDIRTNIPTPTAEGLAYEPAVVPSSTPPGRHAAEDVTFRFPIGVVAAFSVGDEVVVYRFDTSNLQVLETYLVPVSALRTLEPGGIAPDPAELGRYVPGQGLGMADLGAEDLTLVTVEHLGEGWAGSALLTVDLAPPVQLRSARVPVFPGEAFGGWPFRSSLVAYEDVRGHRIVGIESDNGRSGGYSVVLWDLDDPCAEPVIAPPSPTTTVAAQSEAEPRTLPATGGRGLFDQAALGVALVAAGALVRARRTRRPRRRSS